MTALADFSATPLQVHVRAPAGRVRDRLFDGLRRSGMLPTAVSGRVPGTVVVAAGGSVDEAVEECPPQWWLHDLRPVVVTDTFCPDQARRAVRLGVRVMLPTSRATPAGLAAAVRSARCGDGRLPHEVMRDVLQTRRPSATPDVGTIQPLTPRQTSVLALLAEGYANAAIADELSCSEHTVKNVIYDLMARLQVRNRAHAVARAVRAGLV